MTQAEIYYRRKLLDTNESPAILNSDGDSLLNDIILAETQNNLVLQVTEQQYIELLSSALNGAYTTYPEKALTVIYPLIKAGKLEFCEQVIQCIENDPDTKQALSNYFNYNNVELIDPINSVIAGTNLIFDTANCDNDKLFGAITGLVDFMNNLATDFLEMLANSTNVSGRLGDAIEAIPIIGELPFDDLFQLVESLAEDFAQNYSAYYTTTLRDKYRCDIFCMSTDTCNIDFQEMFDYFNAQLVQAIIPDDLADFLDYFVNGIFAGEQIVHAFHAFISGIMLFGQKILDVDSEKMSLVVSAMFNDPDSDWSILCTCGWTSTIDFTVSQSGFIFQTDDNANPIGQWQNGTGLIIDNVIVSGAQRNQLLGSVFFDGATITSIRMIGEFTEGTLNGAYSPALFVRGDYNGVEVSGTRVERQYSDYTQGVPTPVDIQSSGYSETLNSVRIFMRSSVGSYTGYGEVYTLVITGTGTKPQQLP